MSKAARTDRGTAERTVRAYHRSSALDPARPPRAPRRLVRATEPVPFRRYDGAPRLALAAARPPDAAAPAFARFDRDGVARLLGDAVGLAAWKTVHEARFGLRVVPSAGNLHPLETYVVARGLEPDTAGVYHYSPFDHALERRRALDAAAWPDPKAEGRGALPADRARRPALAVLLEVR